MISAKNESTNETETTSPTINPIMNNGIKFLSFSSIAVTSINKIYIQ